MGRSLNRVRDGGRDHGRDQGRLSYGDGCDHWNRRRRLQDWCWLGDGFGDGFMDRLGDGCLYWLGLRYRWGCRWLGGWRFAELGYRLIL